MNEVAQKLQAPFKEDEYEWRVQSASRDETKVNVLCYVQARAIQNRLDEVFGPFGWQNVLDKGPDKGVICGISVWCDEIKQWVTKWDGAENTDIESVKGGISGAIKRAAVQWGIGRLLYNLDATWVELKGKGQHYYKCKDNSYKYWDEPSLPDWAVSSRTPKSPPKTKTPPAKPATHDDESDLTPIRVSLTALCSKAKVPLLDEADMRAAAVFYRDLMMAKDPLGTTPKKVAAALDSKKTQQQALDTITKYYDSCNHKEGDAA